MGNQVTVDVKTAWLSKINWGEAVKAVALLTTIWGFPIPAGVQHDAVVGLQSLSTLIISVGGIYTWVMRTWFTTSLTHASIGGK